jgi:hypothetical protein
MPYTHISHVPGHSSNSAPRFHNQLPASPSRPLARAVMCSLGATAGAPWPGAGSAREEQPEFLGHAVRVAAIVGYQMAGPSEFDHHAQARPSLADVADIPRRSTRSHGSNPNRTGGSVLGDYLTLTPVTAHRIVR